jgi:hypothetical protein
LCAPLGRQINPAFGVGEEILTSFRRPGIDDLVQLLFAVLEGLRGQLRRLFEAPMFLLSLSALAFDLCLAVSLLDAPRGHGWLG